MKRLIRICLVSAVFFLVLMSTAVASGDIIYVKVGGTGDGSSWASAYGDLQDALDEPPSYGDQIWVAEGTYYPSSDYGLGIGDRGKHFRMINGVGIYGGFAGTETALAERDVQNNETILSGDIGVVDDDSDNCYHVFRHPGGTNLDSTAALDGFIITKGRADSELFHRDSMGAGMYNYESNPTLINCIFHNNVAGDEFVYGSGGGIFNQLSIPTVTSCTFSENFATWNGGGMYNLNGSSPTVLNCTFSGNGALYGGGMCNFDSNSSSPNVTNCTFTGNRAAVYGGGGGGGVYNNNSNPILTNNIFWGNTAANGDDIYNDASAPVISYCNIDGGGGSGSGWDTSLGTDGGGNIDNDPLFIDADGPDDIAGTEDDNLRLSAGSPCIDAGDNDSVPAGVTTDLDSNPRFVDDPYTPDTGNGTYPIVDMGAYEYVPPVIYVDEGATGGNNGIYWTNAYNYLADALNDAHLAYGYSIWVAEGTYRPDEDTVNPAGTGLRTDIFGLISGVAIYGGFPSGGSYFEDRDPILYETILSGDLLENDGPDFANNDENSYHVVTGSGTDPNAILDGFTITGGNADGDYSGWYGGGMYNYNGSPTLRNCTFSTNQAEHNGGGMYNDYYSTPTLTNCTFSGNSAVYGGGIENYRYSNPTVTNCTFSGNTSGFGGGGMDNLRYSSPTVTNCTFIGNRADYGGGLENFVESSPTVTNCTFIGNSADYGGGIYNEYYSNPLVSNCILWGNTAANGNDIYNDTSAPVISYCDISGCGGSDAWDSSFGTDGGGNIDQDPMFKDADGDDDIYGTEDDNLQLAYDSPCIDAGDSNSVPADYADLDEDGDTSEQTPLDLAYNDRFTDDPVIADTGTGTPPIVDMGVYERYEFCGDANYPYPPGDENGDCVFDLNDFAIMAQYWLQYTGPE